MVQKSASFGWLFAAPRWAILLLAAAVVARAHDPGLSTAEGELRADSFQLTIGFAPTDAERLLPRTVQTSRTWTQAEFDSAREYLEAIAPRLWEMRAGGSVVAPRETRVQLAAGDNLTFRLTFPRPPGPFTLRALKLGELPPGHREFVLIVDERGSSLTKKLLNAKDDTLEVDPAEGQVPGAGAPEGKQATPPVPLEFVKLGIEHIWTGYDHLLFLFALLVVCRSFKSIVAIISCFTLAHSLTLALATLNIVNLPSRFVEPAIAASIIFVGAENLVRRGAEPPGRWALTFAFGLIHGFGFASVLRELGVGSGGQGIGMPLFTFNLGVEIGQVAIAAVVLPIVWRLRKNETFARRGPLVISAVVTLAGLYWFLERTVFA